MNAVEQVLGELGKVFRASRSKYEANVRAHPILEQASREPGFLTAVLEQFVRTPGALDVGNYPVVGITIDSNPHFSLVANCWIPLPSRDVDVSTKAIHHHGDLLLSTATIFGAGYEHWMFTLPTEVTGSEAFTMQLLEAAPHPLHHVSFIDAWTAHVPFYPKELSITLALWTSRHPMRWPDRIKRLPPFKGREEQFRRLALALGLRQRLELKVVESYDYFPSDRGFEVMRDRKEFQRGPNEDHVYSVFHVLQRTGNSSLAGAVRASLSDGRIGRARPVVERLLGDLENDRPIEGRLSAGHFGLPYANFTRAAVRRALATTSRPNLGGTHGSQFAPAPHREAGARAAAQ